MTEPTAVCKLILLGNGSVGKTSICQRFKDDGFQKVYRQTVGLDFLEKRLEIRCGCDHETANDSCFCAYIIFSY